MKALVALIAGVLFGAGLMVGGMTDPAKVIGFLDIAGRWNPSLAFVMGAALCLTLPVFQLFKGRRRPLLEERFFLPTRTDVDVRLLLGAGVFGVGWGIAGLCPGPAVANLSTGSPQVLAFVLAMILGMRLSDRFASRVAPALPGGTAAAR